MDLYLAYAFRSFPTSTAFLGLHMANRFRAINRCSERDLQINASKDKDGEGIQVLRRPRRSARRVFRPAEGRLPERRPEVPPWYVHPAPHGSSLTRQTNTESREKRPKPSTNSKSYPTHTTF